MHFYGFLNQFDHFFTRCTDRDTAGQVGRVCSEAVPVFFDHHRVLHDLIILQASLFEDAVQGPGRNRDAGFSGNGNRAGFYGVPKLPVATLHPDLLPPILLE